MKKLFLIFFCICFMLLLASCDIINDTDTTDGNQDSESKDDDTSKDGDNDTDNEPVWGYKENQ